MQGAGRELELNVEDIVNESLFLEVFKPHFQPLPGT